MRTLLALLLCLVATAARATPPAVPCPTFVAGWALSGTGPITAIMWDSVSQQMYFVWNTKLVSDYWPVPSYSTIQTFSQTPQANWVQTFNYLIAPTYHAIWLQEVNNCPILQDGYLTFCDLLNENGFSLLITESGVDLETESQTCIVGPGGFVWVN